MTDQDYTDHTRWGLVIDSYREVAVRISLTSNKDILSLRKVIPQIQHKSISETLAMFKGASCYEARYPRDYGLMIVETAQDQGMEIVYEERKRVEYMVFDIAEGDLLEMDDEEEYHRIVEILRANENPVVDSNEY